MDDATKAWLKELGLKNLREARAILRDLNKTDAIAPEDFEEFVNLTDVDFSFGGRNTRVACLPKFPDEKWGDGWEREAALAYFEEKYPTQRLGLPFATARFWCQRVYTGKVKCQDES